MGFLSFRCGFSMFFLWFLRPLGDLLVFFHIFFGFLQQFQRLEDGLVMVSHGFYQGVP